MAERSRQQRSRQRKLFETGSSLATHIPRSVSVPAGETIARALVRARPQLATDLRRNLRRVRPNATDRELEALVRDAFGAYGRYWVDTMQLPSLPVDVVDAGFSVTGYERILEVQATGIGPILALPHLGGWEWAAAWLGRVAEQPIAAVVEQLEPLDVFEWFREVRQAYGVEVIPLGPEALPSLVKSIKAASVVCLLVDRDIVGNGVEVEFFGHPTRLPSGPALLARRTGAPILPAAVYFDGATAHCKIGPAIEVDPSTRLRPYLTETTQRVAHALEDMIDEAPGQWHVLQPVWPRSSPDGLAPSAM